MIPAPLRRPHVRDVGALLLLLCSAVMLTWLAYRPSRSVELPMDTPTAMLPSTGLHDLEHYPDAAWSYRWTQGSARIKLPNPGGVALVRLLLAGGPARAVPVQLGVGDASVGFTARPEPQFVTMLLPPASGEHIPLTIDSPTINEHERDLGVVVGPLHVVGGGAAPTQAMLALLLATVGGYLLLRHAGLNLLLAAGAILLVQGLAAAWQGAGAWRYGLFGPLLLLLGGASLGALALVSWMRRPGWRSDGAEVPFPQQSRWSRLDWQVVAVVIVVALAVRLPWLIAADPVGDLELAARRMGRLYADGLAGAYIFDGDYMPLRLYLLRALSTLVPRLGGGFAAPLPAPTLLLIKLPGLLADLATIGIIYDWSRRWQPVRRAAAIAALYTLAPPVWMNVAWWGQVDALLMLPLMLAVVLLDRFGGRWSWSCWAIALLIKPQAIIFAPLLYAATLRRYGTRGLVQGGGLALGLIVLACVPLVLVGQGPGLMQAYVGSVGRFPQLTNGAYNLWYLVTLGRGGPDLGQGVGPFSFRLIGLALMGFAALLVGLVLLRRADVPTRVRGAAILALAFFLLPTQIHERYLFLSLAFVALAIATDERMAVPFLVLVISATINIVGELDGFVPRAYAVINASPLPLALTLINLLVLIYLIVDLLVHRRARTADALRVGVRRPAARRSASQ